MNAKTYMLDTDTFSYLVSGRYPAAAISTGSTLVTNNERHFRHVPGLNIENWTR